MIPFGEMEPAGRLIGKLKFPDNAAIAPEELARAAWPVAVGKRVAAHAYAARMAGSRLIVEVEDDVWRRQLFALTSHILASLAKRLGPGVVAELEFRVVPPRRQPQRAEQLHSQTSARDDADEIADPVLRKIYKASRKRALA